MQVNDTYAKAYNCYTYGDEAWPMLVPVYASAAHGLLKYLRVHPCSCARVSEQARTCAYECVRHTHCEWVRTQAMP